MQAIAITAAQCQLRSVLQQDVIFAVPPRPQLTDAVDVHDLRTVNPRKLLWIELRLQPGRDTHAAMWMKPLRSQNSRSSGNRRVTAKTSGASAAHKIQYGISQTSICKKVGGVLKIST